MTAVKIYTRDEIAEYERANPGKARVIIRSRAAGKTTDRLVMLKPGAHAPKPPARKKARTYRDIDDSTLCACHDVTAQEALGQLSSLLQPVFAPALTEWRRPRQKPPERPLETIKSLSTLDAPELRVIRARAAGFETIETEVDGNTRAKYRKMETPFDQAKRHKWITADQHKALDMLCNSFQKAGLLPSITMNWSQVLDGSHEAGSSEPRERHARRFREAMAILPADYRDGFLSWFISAQSDDVSVHDLGAYFTEMKHKEARKAVGAHILRLCARIFSDHFGLTEKKSRARLKIA